MRFFYSLEKISRLEWESNPHSHISGVMLYQLSYQAPWEQGGGKEGIQVLVLGAHYIRRKSLSKEKISGLVYKCYSNDSLMS